MAQSEIITLVTAIAAFIALLVGLIANLQKLRDFFRRLIDCATKRKVKKMTRLYQQECEAYSQLPGIKRDLESVKSLTVALIRDRIIQKTRYHQQQGYISDIDAELLLSDFLDYHCSSGNGPVLNYVSEAMQLPRTEGGMPRRFDMALTIERELYKRAQKRKRGT